MARLITFGCSGTYGVGLPNPEKQVWGSLLSSYLNREFVNQGIPGASNKEIVNAIINFEFQPDDMVFILWTMIDRYGVLNSKDDFTQFLPMSPHPLSIQYYKDFHTYYDHLFLFKVFVEYAINFLKKKNIQSNSLFNHHPGIKVDAQHTLLDTTFGNFWAKFPRAKDGLHMGVEGNEEFAKHIYYKGFTKYTI